MAAETWPDDSKKAVLGQFLSGGAALWFMELTKANPSITYAECGEALIETYRPRITDPEIMSRIREEYKRASETYREFANRLITMANATRGGMDNDAVGLQALSTFIAKAYPRHYFALKLQVDMRSTTPLHELNRAVELLEVLADSDGRRQQDKRRRTDQCAGQRRQATDNEKPGQAHVVIDRKRKPGKKQSKAPFTCYECGQPGHSADFHRRFLEGKVTLGPCKPRESHYGPTKEQE
jgi:hypothetical protein